MAGANQNYVLSEKIKNDFRNGGPKTLKTVEMRYNYDMIDLYSGIDHMK